MKKTYKTLLLICCGFSLVLTARTQASTTYPAGHLLAGFTKQSGNDLVYDLGLASSLTDGQTWNLGTLLTTNFTLSTVNWGIVGDTNSPRSIWTTTAGAQPNNVTTSTMWSALNSSAGTLYQYFPAPGGTGEYLMVDSSLSDSWNIQTINGTLNSDYINAYENPNVTGLTSAYLWYALANNTTPKMIGYFTLSSGGTITYHVAGTTVTPPPPGIVSVQRSGSTTTIFFTTTNGSFTYALYYTNSAGISAPATNWTALGTTVTGNGLTNSLSDTTTATNRFYRVGVH